MTTGDPGTSAQVVNSGTEQQAVFDFTIPQGQNGSSGGEVVLLSAYSTPPQAAAAGAALNFDLNALSFGSAISHTERSGDFTISKPGVYAVSFFGGISPASSATFPSNVTLSLTLNGSIVPGGTAAHVFHMTTENANVSVSLPVRIDTAPATLRMIVNGGAIFYNGVTMTIYRLGDIPMS